MMNDNDKFNAVFNPRDGDPHRIAANDSEDYFEWPDMVFPGVVVAFVAGFVWWLA